MYVPTCEADSEKVELVLVSFETDAVNPVGTPDMFAIRAAAGA